MAIKNIVIDTNVYTGILKGDIDYNLIFEKFDLIIMTSIVIGELRAGFKLGKKTKKNEDDLQSVLNNNNVNTVSIDDETTNYYANIFKQLRANGKPIPTNDIWIAASCLQHNAQIATLDKHFSYVKGIKIFEV